MDRAGGFGDYLLLLQDEQAYEDLLLVIHGEADAAAIRKMEDGLSQGW